MIADGRNTDIDPSPLRKGFEGEVVLPGDAVYDQARSVWNGMVDRSPALIARCAGVPDVTCAIRFAREQGLEIGVRGGGHGILGLAVPEGGLMIDLSLMRNVRVDPERRRAWIQGGALLGRLDEAAQAYGLATTAGNVSHTGVGGLTLGGGMGWLARQFGLACDNVARYQVVTADGSVVHASQAENPDLFWGLRGGGGNFGVVTEFEFLLHPVPPSTLGVDLFYTQEAAPVAMRRWRDLLEEASLETTLTAWSGTAGEWDFLPRELWGRPLTSVGYVWIGDQEEGLKLIPALAPIKPAAQRIRRLTYVELQRVDDDTQRHRIRRYWKGHFLRAFPDAAIGAFIARGASDGGDPLALPSGDLQAYGGAIGAVGDQESAFDHRDALVEFVARTRWEQPGEDVTRTAAGRRFAAALEPFAEGAYVNSIGDPEDGVSRVYRATKLARLSRLKAHYDPDNIFHLNHNIKPASAGDLAS